MRVDYVSHSGDDLLVVDAARCSFDKQSEWGIDGELLEKDQKLIRFLAREGHWLPFRHPQLTLRIHAPLFVLRQLDKHQVGFSTSEVSRRYVTNEPEFYQFTWRHRPDGSIKQGSGANVGDPDMVRKVNAMYQAATNESLDTYHTLLALGISPEQARAALPQSMYTTQVKTGSLLGWMQMYKLRIDSHAQREMQDLAKMVYRHLRDHFPSSIKAIKEYL